MTNKDKQRSYVKACSEKGFTVDYSKGDAHYYANNAEGYRLSLQWYGEASSYQPENTILWITARSMVQKSSDSFRRKPLTNNYYIITI
jgi:hypothetical protein